MEEVAGENDGKTSFDEGKARRVGCCDMHPRPCQTEHWGYGTVNTNDQTLWFDECAKGLSVSRSDIQ